jgi:hypothetical protein
MTHNANHLTRESSRCNRNGHCLYGFPHPLTQQTWIDDQGRVHYRRRSEEDLWIVSHIPELIDELDCHIHCDAAYTTYVFCYLYKYLFKGPDHAFFSLLADSEDREPRNECQEYIRGRYLSAMEASWRILRFDISRKIPSVDSLIIHLPGQNIPQFAQGGMAHGSTLSTLISYFNRPESPLFTDLKYADYYKQYILYPYDGVSDISARDFLEKPFNGRIHHIIRRRQSKKVIRIQTVPPSVGEAFYLRSLLLHRSASSFEDLRTIHGHTFCTYHEAALSLGIFTASNEGFYTMQEAVLTCQTPGQLRFLFSRLILEGYPATQLWDSFRQQISYDYSVRFNSEDLGMNNSLQVISNYLREVGRTLSDFGLPEPLNHSPETLSELAAFATNLTQRVTDSQMMEQSLNDEQRNFYDLILSCIYETTQVRFHEKVFFLEGKPGRGKTFIVNALCSRLRCDGKIVLVVASSALAATLYERSRTAHNLFKIEVKEVRLLHAA